VSIAGAPRGRPARCSPALPCPAAAPAVFLQPNWRYDKAARRAVQCAKGSCSPARLKTAESAASCGRCSSTGQAAAGPASVAAKPAPPGTPAKVPAGPKGVCALGASHGCAVGTQQACTAFPSATCRRLCNATAGLRLTWCLTRAASCTTSPRRPCARGLLCLHGFGERHPPLREGDIQRRQQDGGSWRGMHALPSRLHHGAARRHGGDRLHMCVGRGRVGATRCRLPARQLQALPGRRWRRTYLRATQTRPIPAACNPDPGS